MTERFRMLALHRWSPEFMSRSLHVEFVVDESESGYVLLEDSPVFNLPQISFHQFLHPHFTNFVNFICLVLLRQAWSAGTVVWQGLLVIGASSHFIPRPGLVPDTSSRYHAIRLLKYEISLFELIIYQKI